MTVRCDLARVADVEAMIAQTVAAFGPLRILVNNAAVFEYKPLTDITEGHFRSHFDTNVLGLLMTTKFAVANFDPAGGSVINISSLAAEGDAPGRAVLHRDQGGRERHHEGAGPGTCRTEDSGKRDHAGYVDTEGSRAFGIAGSEAEAKLLASTPLAQRPGQPSDIRPRRPFSCLGGVRLDDGRDSQSVWRDTLAVHGQAARDADRLAGDERGIVACQEADHAGNILGLADALHRDGADQRGAHFLAALVVARDGRQEGRIGRAGTDRVERDTPCARPHGPRSW